MPIRILALFFFCGLASAFAQSEQNLPARSIVFSAQDPAAIKDYRTNPAVVRAMVNRLVLAVTAQPDLLRAWRSLVSPNDKIGIKISAAGGELFTTHRDVVNAIVDGLVAAGQSRDKIIVWDRSLGGIRAAGYQPGKDGYQLRAVSPADGYDPKAAISAPLLGKLVWGDLEYKADQGEAALSASENTSTVSHMCKILSSEVTKIINVPVLSTTETNGIAGCLYNVTIPNIDNWRRFIEGSRFGAPSIAEMYQDPRIGKKVVLNLMDGLLAQFAGGPQSQPNYALHHAALYASKDPVAIDAVVLKKIGEWRANANLPAITREASYIKIAAQLGLGNSEANRIEIKHVGH